MQGYFFRAVLGLWALGAAAGAIAQAAVQVAGPVPSCRSVSVETCNVAAQLGRGINLGNMLEAPKEGDWGIRADPRYIDIVGSNFSTVRVPVRWSNHAAPSEDATLDSWFADRVDKVVDSLLDKGVYVILNMHHYNQLFGDKLLPGEFEVAPEVLEKRFLNIWQQIAERYKGRSDRLIFELLNEPHGKLDSNRWNALLAKALKIVRANNPKRVVLVGPTYWNASRDLAKLSLPPDRYLIVALHNYDPFNFTHQGAKYVPINLPVGVGCCDEQQRRSITDALDVASNWSAEKGYPIHLGEFGSSQAADMPSRENYTRFVRDEAEKRGFGWTYWEFGSSFGVYDPRKGNWVEPIRRALLD